MKIKFKALGAKFEIEVAKGSNYTQALNALGEVTCKPFENVDLFVDGSKVKDWNEEVEKGTTITVLKTKHSSAAIKVVVKTLGTKLSVECDDDVNCKTALEVFEKVSGKVLGNEMDIFVNGDKVADTSAKTLQNNDEVVAVKSKHESATV